MVRSELLELGVRLARTHASAGRTGDTAIDEPVPGFGSGHNDPRAGQPHNYASWVSLPSEVRTGQVLGMEMARPGHRLALGIVSLVLRRLMAPYANSIPLGESRWNFWRDCLYVAADTMLDAICSAKVAVAAVPGKMALH